MSKESRFVGEKEFPKFQAIFNNGYFELKKRLGQKGWILEAKSFSPSDNLIVGMGCFDNDLIELGLNPYILASFSSRLFLLPSSNEIQLSFAYDSIEDLLNRNDFIGK